MLVDRPRSFSGSPPAATVGGWPLKVPAKNAEPPGRGTEQIHRLRPAGQRRDRLAVGHRFAEGGQVRRGADYELVAAERVPEAGDYFVKDKDRSMRTHSSEASRGNRLREGGRTLWGWARG